MKEWMELDKLCNKCWHINMLQYQPRFVNISKSVISGRLFLSCNGPGRGHLCHTDKFLVVPVFHEKESTGNVLYIFA